MRNLGVLFFTWIHCWLSWEVGNTYSYSYFGVAYVPIGFHCILCILIIVVPRRFVGIWKSRFAVSVIALNKRCTASFWLRTSAYFFARKLLKWEACFEAACLSNDDKYKYKWLEGYPQHWLTGEESPLFVAANFPSPWADLLALHHVCSMSFTTLPFDLLANNDCMFTVRGRAADILCYREWSSTLGSSKPYLYVTQCKPEAISITSEIISQLTRWRLRPFSSRVLFVYAFYAFIYAFSDQ